MRPLRPLSERRAAVAPARISLPRGVAPALPAVLVAAAVAALSRYAAPLAEGVSRPTSSQALGAAVDLLLRRRPPPAPAEDEGETGRGDWILTGSLAAQTEAVRCLTSAHDPGCALHQRPVAERVLACSPLSPDPCADDRPAVRVCQIPLDGGVSRTSPPACAGNHGAPQWILFTNRDMPSSPRELERSCLAEIRRWCVWRPRSLEATSPRDLR